MSEKPISIAEMRDRINKNELVDPLITLESIMNGQDPRRVSELYKLVMDIEEMNHPDSDIARGDWDVLVDFVVNHAKYELVGIKQTIAAAKILAEYVHPKIKHSDEKGGGGLNSVISEPLTKEEIILFSEVYNDEF